MSDTKKDMPWLDHYDQGVQAHLKYPEFNLADLLVNSAKRFPNHTALVFQNQIISYRGLLEKVRKLASFLVVSGVKIGDRVGLILPNSPQFVIAYYAILMAGGIVTAINPGYTEDEVYKQVKSCGIKNVICLAEFQPIIVQLSKKLPLSLVILTELDDPVKSTPMFKRTENLQDGKVCWSRMTDILQNTVISGVELPSITSDQPAVFQFSGGTTGIPKAAIGTHRNLVANTIQFRSWLHSLREGSEVVMAVIPLFHVYGMVIGMNLAIYLGAKLVLLSNSRIIEEVVKEIHRNKVTIFPGVPSLFNSINNFPCVRDYDLSSIEACISGSAPLPLQVKTNFEALTGGKVMEGYGLSEAPTATHCNPLLGENKSGSIGLPLPDVNCRVVSLTNDRKVVNRGEPGELLINGPQVMKEYYRNSKETQNTLRGGWLHTGDIVRMDEDGYFYVVGRKKELIKVGGLQVWPNEIEEVINTHPAVSQSAVAGIPDIRQGEVPAAWIVLKDSQSVNEDELKEWCKKKLAGYKVPKIFQFCKDLPRTAVGKVLRRVLIEQYKNAHK